MRALIGSFVNKLYKWKSGLIVSLFLLLLIVPYIAPYTMHFIIPFLLYFMTAEALNLIAGYVGEVSLGQASFFGIGAYVTALLALHKVNCPGIDVVLSGLGAAGVALTIGYPFLRLRGTYFSIGMLCFSEILRVFASNSEFLRGMEGIAVPFIVPYSIIPYYYSIVILVLITIFSIYKIVNSSIGIAYISIRDDIQAAKMMGINTTAYKMSAFILSAFFVGLAGGFYAHYNSYIDPDGVFSMAINFKLVNSCLIGGMGTITGPIIGVVFILLLEEIGRKILLHGYLLLLAAVLIVTFLFMPGGVMGVIEGKVPIQNPLKSLRKVKTRYGSS